MEAFQPEDFKNYLKLIHHVSYGKIPVYFSTGANDIIIFCVHGAGCKRGDCQEELHHFQGNDITSYTMKSGASLFLDTIIVPSSKIDCAIVCRHSNLRLIAALLPHEML